MILCAVTRIVDLDMLKSSIKTTSHTTHIGQLTEKGCGMEMG